MKMVFTNHLLTHLPTQSRNHSFTHSGFITVLNRNNKKRKRNDDNKRTGTEQPRHRGEKKKKNKELKNFYTFQIKEQKIEKLELLRKKFEEDKERVAAMKAARKFKPF